MVDLPPSVEELNEYARFSFLNEMHEIAAQIMSCIVDDRSATTRLKLGLELIEEERASMRELFKNGYTRPKSKRVVTLILRCAELYLDLGFWFDLCHGDLRLREKHLDDQIDALREVFHETNFLDRYSISSPIIELTLTRIEMMSFFQRINTELICDAPTNAVDPLSHFQLDGIGDIEPSCLLMNTAEVPEDVNELQNQTICDTEYLRRRERYAWAYYRELRPVASLFSLLYYAIFSVVAIVDLSQSDDRLPVAASIATGFSTFIFASEVISLRLCQIRSCRPTEPIPYLYPGVEFYFIQYTVACLGSIAILIALILDKFESGLGVTVLTIQHIVALLAPWLCYPCMMTWRRRGDRLFRWVRVGFFNSCWWMVIRVLFFVFLTPGVFGIQIIIASDIRNKATVSEAPDQTALMEL
jgi:hypothetical protein